MSNQIQIKRSVANAVVTGLANGELAFTQNSNVLYIGAPDGSSGSLAIGGLRNPGTLTANQALVANSTSGIDKIITANAVITTLWANGTGGSNGQVLVTNGSAVFWGTGTSGSNTQVQFNDSGVSNGSAGFTFDKTSDTLAVSNAVQTIYITGSNGSRNITTNYGSSDGAVGVSTDLYVGVSGTGGDIWANGHFFGNGYYINSIGGSSITWGTIAEPRLPYRMNQDVRTSDSVSFNNLTLSGNLVVNGSSVVIGGNTVAFTDNMIYLNQGIETSITNISGNGTYVVFTANNNYQAGWDVDVTGVNPSSYNGTYLSIYAANSTTFTVANTNTAAYVSGGTAKGESSVNPDLGFAAGYNDGTYHHAGFFRDHATGTWKVFDSYLPEPDASIYIDQSNASFHLANFQANTIYVGNNTSYATINLTSFTGTANNSNYLSGNTVSDLHTYSDNMAANAYSNAIAYSGNAAQAYSNAVLYAANVYTNAVNYAANAAANAYSNATAYADNKAANAYSNAVSYTDNKAANAYSNAVNYAANAAANAYSNAMSDTLSRSGTYTGNNTFNGTTTTFGSNLSISSANISATNATLNIKDIVASGNLTINGTLTTVNTQNLIVTDPMIKLADNQANTATYTDVVDVGFYSEYGNTANTYYTGFFRDHAASTTEYSIFKLFHTHTEPGSTVNTGDASYKSGKLVAWLSTPSAVSEGFQSNNTLITLTANSTMAVQIAANTLSLSTALPATSGGTGLASYTAGDILYASNTSSLSALGIAANGQVLQVVNNIPAWGVLDGGTF